MPRDLPIENWALLLLFVMLATFISLTLVRRRGSRRGLTTREAARDQLARLRDQRDIRDSMDSLLVRLEEFSREVNAQLDTKFTRLELSIRDADQRTDRLRNTIAEHDRRLEALLAVQRRRGGGTAGGPSSNTESKTSAVL
jgi:septal ring factor EnvC (AmiA/AmiB activator)